jgi:hypothetical protein
MNRLQLEARLASLRHLLGDAAVRVDRALRDRHISRCGPEVALVHAYHRSVIRLVHEIDAARRAEDARAYRFPPGATYRRPFGPGIDTRPGWPRPPA